MVEGVDGVREQQSVKGAGEGDQSHRVMRETKEVEEMSLTAGCERGRVPNERVSERGGGGDLDAWRCRHPWDRQAENS